MGDARVSRPAVPNQLVEISRQHDAELARPRIILAQPDLQRDLLGAVRSRNQSLRILRDAQESSVLVVILEQRCHRGCRYLRRLSRTDPDSAVRP